MFVQPNKFRLDGQCLLQPNKFRLDGQCLCSQIKDIDAWASSNSMFALIDSMPTFPYCATKMLCLYLLAKNFQCNSHSGSSVVRSLPSPCDSNVFSFAFLPPLCSYLRALILSLGLLPLLTHLFPVYHVRVACLIFHNHWRILYLVLNTHVWGFEHQKSYSQGM